MGEDFRRWFRGFVARRDSECKHQRPERAQSLLLFIREFRAPFSTMPLLNLGGREEAVRNSSKGVLKRVGGDHEFQREGR